MSRSVAVTGATGFIGRALVKALLDQGWEVRALRRAVRPLESPARPGLAWISGDLDDQDCLEHLTRGVRAVIHCAGAVRGRTQAQFDRVNVEGVRKMASAVLAQPCPPRLIALSSLAAREPALSHYAASKRGGEEVLLALGEKLEWLALRPPAVYGPGDRELLPLFQWMARGLALIPGSRQARFSLLYVDDLVRAILCGLEMPSGRSGVYELDDGRAGGYGWEDVVAAVASLRGARVRKCYLPSWALRGLAALNGQMARVAGYAPMLTPGKARELLHEDWVCHDTSPWRDACGWAPRISLSEGLRKTLYPSHGTR